MSRGHTGPRIHVPDELREVLLEFTISYLLEQPGDVISYAAEYFTRLREARTTSRVYGEAVSARDDELLSPDESVMSKDEEPSIRFAGRRKSVFAETYNPEEDDDDDEGAKLVFPKSDEQRQRLATAVKNILLFRSLDKDQMNDVLDAMFERVVKKDELVIKQGDDGDNFYVIQSGTFQVFVTPDQSKEPNHIHTYEDSGSFGELALLYNMPRAATVKAVTEGSLWAMDRHTFRRIILKSAFKKRKMYETLIESVPMLKTLQPYERMNLADALVPRVFNDGDRIIKQGDVADGMYFVELGEVVISVLDDSGKEVEINRIGKGGYFGELALVTHRPRAASAFCDGEVRCAFSAKNVVCYFASWTVYRPKYGKFDVPDIDPSLCTHINFAFIGLNEDASIHILDSWESNDAGGYNGFRNIVGLRQKNPNLKVSVSMGGWNEGSSNYSLVAADPQKRKLLAANILSFIKKWDFDGFDLDWEYPTRRGGEEKDKKDFTELLKEISNVLRPKGYLLSVAVAGGYDKILSGYEVPEINKLVDMLNVMVFDFHGAFENDIGHLSPLYPAEVDNLYHDNYTYNVDFGIQTWLNEGSSPDKINLGVVFYGRTFTMDDNRNTSLYAPINGPGKAGPYTNQEGYLGYHEICEFHLNSSTYVWDSEQHVPHIYWDDQWVGFEDSRSMKEKVKYAVDNDLGGIMIWSLDYDDFRGRCGPKYHLLNTINSALKEYV